MTGTATPSRRRPARIDQVCGDALELAREALLTAFPEAVDSIGGHVRAAADDERTVTHFFECGLPGYQGWHWAATVTRVPRSKHVTVCETTLLPGPEALIPPRWVPWSERLQPGEVGVGDLLPTPPEDERLMPGYVLSDDPAAEAVAWELGLGRTRVLSRAGRIQTAQRWYEGNHGPHAPIAKAAPEGAQCGACAFYVPLAGALRLAFGVCANEYAADDGKVVSVDHGCGAFSELFPEMQLEQSAPLYDDAAVDAF